MKLNTYINTALFLCLAFFASFSCAQSLVVDESTDFAHINVMPYLYQLADEHSEISSHEILSNNYDPEFSLVPNQTLFQYNDTNGQTWLSFSIHSKLKSSKKVYLATDSVDLYCANLIQLHNTNILLDNEIGVTQSFSELEGTLANHDFEITLLPGENRFFLKLMFNETSSFPVYITQSQHILQSQYLKLLLVGIGLSFTLLILGICAWLKIYRSKIVPFSTFLLLITLLGFQMSNANIFTLLFTNSIMLDVELRFFFGFLFTASILLFNLSQLQLSKKTFTSLSIFVVFTMFAFFILLFFTSLLSTVLTLILCFSNIILSCLTLINLKKFELRSRQFLLLLYVTTIMIGLIFALATFNYFGSTWSLFVTTQIMSCILPLILALTIYHKYKESMIQENPSRHAVNDQHWPLLKKINHDLRSPINAVLGMTELLQDMQLSVNQQSYINTVHTAGIQLSNYMDEIQNLVRIGNQTLPTQDKEINLLQFINQLIEPFIMVTQNKSIEIIVNTAPNLPSSILANEKLLLQSLRSILDNAVNFTESGEIEIQLSLPEKNKIRFTIRDTGNGISQEILQNIFNFSSWDAKNLQRSHLGLPIAKALVEKMDGHLNLETNNRTGTKICIDIPLTIAKHADINPTDYEALNDIKVLIVDDNPTCRKVLELQVTELGMRFDSANNGQTAIAMLRNEYQKNDPFDLILLDHQMPNMTGVDLLQRIRDDQKVNKDIKTIILTGLDININDELVRKVNICSVLNKPISSVELRNQLLKAIETPS